jgi:CO/xanthine dehydrogenase FAD-binding subunit
LEEIPSKSAAQSFRRIMKTCKKFHYSKSNNDALAVINQSKGKVAVLAGGADNLLVVQQRNHPQVNSHLENSSIPKMKALEKHQDQILIGAAVPHRTITNDPPQIKAHSQAPPAADGMIALMPLNARVEVTTQNSRRLAPLADLLKTPAQITSGHRRLSRVHRPLHTLLDALYRIHPRKYPNHAQIFNSLKHHPHRFSVICPKRGWITTIALGETKS